MKQTLALVMALAAGCSFNPGKDNNDMGGTGDDMGGAGDDMLTDTPDLMMVCTPGAKTCASGMLSTCNPDGSGVDTATCVLGCNAAGNDCQALQPTAPAVASDFVYGGLSELTIAAAQTLLVFDTDTGEIRDGAGAVVRMPNATPMSRNVESGIGFHRTSGVGIWTFSKLTVPATTTIVFKNPYAASILSASDLTIAGTIDVRGYADPTQSSTLCMGTVAGPGGTIGGTQAQVAMGTGAGGGAPDMPLATGGGGGGYGDTGGDGGKHGATNGGAKGTTAGMPAINPLAGGFGGGASGGNGGGGGGALQLAAEGTLTISGKINAGGCGGNPGDATHGGGGGGSGGAILIEAPTVHVSATGILAANGGGGGGGGSATAAQGDAGKTSDAQANGGAGNGGQNGGSGGSLGTTNGQPGSNGTGAGGGGGGVGRVRLNSRTGATIDGGSIISPAQTAGTVVIQ